MGIPDWLLDEIYGLPIDVQYSAYQAIDERARMNAAVFAEEMYRLQQDLAQIQQMEFRVAMTARWIGTLYPELQIDVMRIVEGGRRSFIDGFCSAANGVRSFC